MLTFNCFQGTDCLVTFPITVPKLHEKHRDVPEEYGLNYVSKDNLFICPRIGIILEGAYRACLVFTYLLPGDTSEYLSNNLVEGSSARNSFLSLCTFDWFLVLGQGPSNLILEKGQKKKERFIHDFALRD